MNQCCRLSGSRAFKLLVVLFLLGLMLVGFKWIRNVEVARQQATLERGEASTLANFYDTFEGTRSSIQLDEETSSKAASSQPLLPDDRPDWVAQPDLVEGEIHRIAIGTELANSIDECRNKLDVALVEGMERYVKEHLLQNRRDLSKMPELSAAWIREHLLDSDQEYEAMLERPAGTFYQLWVQLKIDAKSRATIEQWSRRHETRSRAGLVGAAAVSSVFCLAIMNFGLRFFTKKVF